MAAVHLDHNEVKIKTQRSWLLRHVNTLVTNKCLPQEVFSTGCSLWCMSWFTAVALLFIASLRPLLPVFLSSVVKWVKENKLCHHNYNVAVLKKKKKCYNNFHIFNLFFVWNKNNMLMHMQISDACFYSQWCVVYASKHIKTITHSSCWAVHLDNFFGILCQPEYVA